MRANQRDGTHRCISNAHRLRIVMQTGAPIYRSYREMTRLPRHHPDPAFSYFASYLSSPSVRFRENEETRVVQFLSVSRNTNSHVDDIKKYYKFTCFFNNNNEIDRFLLINRRTFVYLVQRRKSRLFLPNYDQKNRRERNEAKKQRFLHPGCTFLPSSSPDNSIEKTLRFDRSNLHPRAMKTGSRSR